MPSNNDFNNRDWRLRKKSAENRLIESLTNAVRNKDVDGFERQLKDQLDELEAIYRELPECASDETFKNRRLRRFFGDMCKDDNLVDFIGIFLKRIPLFNEAQAQLDSQYPLHIAVNGNAFKVVRKLLEEERIKVNIFWKGKTPLMLLLQNVSSQRLESVMELIPLLAQKKADINIGDFQMHPLSAICRSTTINHNEKLQLIRQCQEEFSCDVDGAFKVPTRADIEQLSGDLKFERKSTDDRQQTIASFLSQLLKGNEEDFVQGFRNKYENVTEDNIEDICDLLHQASSKNRIKCVEAITSIFKQSKVAFQSSESKKKIVDSLKFVCSKGYANVLKLFLSNIPSTMADVFNESTLLLVCVRKLYRKHSANMMECFKLLLDDKRIQIDKADCLGNTALHYALQRDMNSVSLMILKCKRTPYIGKLNRFSKSPLHLMNAIVFKDYLDSCISVKGATDNSIVDDIKEISINLKGFAPPDVSSRKEPPLISVEDGIRSAGQTAGNLLLSQTHEFASQPQVKKTRRTDLRRMESIDQLNSYEIEPFEYIAYSKELRPLLRHPTLNTILLVKWFQIQWILYTKFALSVVQAVLFTLFAIVPVGSSFYNVLRYSCFAFIMCYIFVFLVIFFHTGKVSCKSLLDISAIKSRINFLEILIAPLALACVTVWNHDNTPLSILVILAGINIVLHMGSLPFATLSSSIVMLETVSRNFIKSILIYIVILVAFGIGFFVLFDTTSNEGSIITPNANETTDSNSNSDEDFNKFKTLTNSIVKSLVMLTGEFDAASFEFQANRASYLLFLGFVFLVSLVIANLINGIAVSDISEIRKEAEILALVKKVETLAFYERIDNPLYLFEHIKSTLAFFSEYNPELIILPGQRYQVEVEIKGEETEKKFDAENKKKKEIERTQFYRWPLTKTLCETFELSWCFRLNEEMANAIQDILATHKSSIPELDQETRLVRVEEKLDQLIAMLGAAGFGSGGGGGGLGGAGQVEPENAAPKRWKMVVRAATIAGRCRSASLGVRRAQ